MPPAPLSPPVTGTTIAARIASTSARTPTVGDVLGASFGVPLKVAAIR
jgi:hypothetical protein